MILDIELILTVFVTHFKYHNYIISCAIVNAIFSSFLQLDLQYRSMWQLH